MSTAENSDALKEREREKDEIIRKWTTPNSSSISEKDEIIRKWTTPNSSSTTSERDEIIRKWTTPSSNSTTSEKDEIIRKWTSTDSVISEREEKMRKWINPDDTISERDEIIRKWTTLNGAINERDDDIKRKTTGDGVTEEHDKIVLKHTTSSGDIKRKEKVIDKWIKSDGTVEKESIKEELPDYFKSSPMTTDACIGMEIGANLGGQQYGRTNVNEKREIDKWIISNPVEREAKASFSIKSMREEEREKHETQRSVLTKWLRSPNFYLTPSEVEILRFIRPEDVIKYGNDAMIN